jgi:asparagine synthase (glutamine-hydrolysing)
MCGICGIFGHKANQDDVARMCRHMVHRGPDDEGFYTEARKVALGIRRLEIIDRVSGHQPIPNEDKTVWTVLNGEIYNFKSLRADLEKKGHRFYSSSDTECLVHLYEEYHRSMLTRLRGMFAFAIWDTKRQALFLARDRLGIKPLYYKDTGPELIFASELGAMVAAGLSERRVEPEAVHHYLSFRAVPPPLTMYRGLRNLPPGHALWKTEKGTEIYPYWDITPLEEAGPAPADSRERLLELVEESVRIRLVSDRPLGTFLSGGIDSTMITAMARRHAGDRLKTFALGFSEGGKAYDELPYARLAAEYLDTDHQEFILSGDQLRKDLPDILRHMDQPTGDALQQFYLYKMTAREVTVALSGTGGDELFGGYNWFNLIMKMEAFEGIWDRLPRHIRAFLEKRLSGPGGPDGRGFRSRFSRFLSCRSSFLKKYCLFKSMIHDEYKPGLYASDFLGRVRASEASESLVAQMILDRAGDPTFEKIAYLQLKTDLPDILLKDADHMSMAHGLEVRLPLIDQRLVRFAASLPPGQKIGRRDNKAILREAARGIVPAKIARRPKMGFIFPMDIWAGTVLRDVIASVFTREAVEKRGYFRYEPVRALYDRFLSGRERFFRVWNLAALELWHRVHIDGRGPDLEGLIE